MKYVANYDVIEFSNENRSINLAATNVMEYIINVLKNYGEVDIISYARTLNKSGFFPGRTTKLTDRVRLKMPFTFGVRTRFGRILSIIWTEFWLLWTLLLSCKRNETILVYHSAAIMPAIKMATKIKNLNLILEIREIYSDININVDAKSEFDFFKQAHKYIFATELLNQKVNLQNKPYIIAPGIYKFKFIPNVAKWDDGKIHLVYAGNFRRAKGGALTSISIAQYLNSNYVIHILGTGDKTSIYEINKLIHKQNSQNKAKIIYEGLLRGEEFQRFLQKCHIGLSTQDPTGRFNDTSFPSKILTYLGAGLEVLSADIKAVSESPIGNFVHYYSNHDPKSIADSILKIKQNKNHIGLLNELDRKLCSEFQDLLN